MPAPEEELNLSTLKPAQKRKARKRVGRGMGSGKGRYSGRGIKGQKSRSGSHTMRPGFEGGQMPIYMRLGKKRGPYSKDAMPVGPHRTHTVAVNVRDLERVFDDGADVSLDALRREGPHQEHPYRREDPRRGRAEEEAEPSPPTSSRRPRGRRSSPQAEPRPLSASRSRRSARRARRSLSRTRPSPRPRSEEAAEAQEAPADEAEEVSSEESASADSEE